MGCGHGSLLAVSELGLKRRVSRLLHTVAVGVWGKTVATFTLPEHRRRRVGVGRNSRRPRIAAEKKRPAVRGPFHFGRLMRISAPPGGPPPGGPPRSHPPPPPPTRGLRGFEGLVLLRRQNLAHLRDELVRGACEPAASGLGGPPCCIGGTFFMLFQVGVRELVDRRLLRVGELELRRVQPEALDHASGISRLGEATTATGPPPPDHAADHHRRTTPGLARARPSKPSTLRRLRPPAFPSISC